LPFIYWQGRLHNEVLARAAKLRAGTSAYAVQVFFEYLTSFTPVFDMSFDGQLGWEIA
jgi:hypothetical protein